MSAVTRTAEARLRLVRALVRQKSTAAAAAGKPIAHIYPNSETPVKALDPLDTFERRHMGPSEKDQLEMLKTIGFESLDELVTSTVPANIRLEEPMELGSHTSAAMSETEALSLLRSMADKNKVLKSLIGQGYNETHTPYVILRNMLENPGWYTAYTPYQAEISQGRLEMLLNYQTLVTELTGMEMANASLLDEATAAAEAMSMCVALSKNGKKKGAMTFFADAQCHPQTIAVVKTRCEALGIEVVVGDATSADLGDACIGVLWQYPNTRGDVVGDAAGVSSRAHAAGALSVVAADPLALTLLPAPGTFGADICVGSMQRYGVPMGFGGPHAAYMATSEKYARRMPGRIIGETVEANERKGRALRMAMQTREQHIRRDKATSNICTAQALLANMAAAYAIYHGPDGLQDIARRCLGLAKAASAALNKAGIAASEPAFDTIVVKCDSASIAEKAEKAGFNLRVFGPDEVGLSFGETVTREDLVSILEDVFGVDAGDVDALADTSSVKGRNNLLPHAVFNTHKSESQMLRYLKQLEDKDLALNHSMISLGSCTMKLNATAEMIPVTWPEFSDVHPFAPREQTDGYVEMIASLNADLCKITGFDAVSVQPNSGASGEYAGLLAIRAYQQSIGEGHRNVCLIPVSAHGTNPASAVMAGLKCVIVKSDEDGNIDLEDFKAKAEKHKDNLSAIMVTYPSTYGVFEETITDLTRITHECGGQVYMDGANLNAQCGLTSPGTCGADVCHLNMHKTFCVLPRRENFKLCFNSGSFAVVVSCYSLNTVEGIRETSCSSLGRKHESRDSLVDARTGIPHGGGGPGVGAIGVNAHLAPFLPGHTVTSVDPSTGDSRGADSAVAAAPYGSSLILPISWMYIKMLGAQGLARASAIAILNANYMAKRLEDAYSVLFRGANGQCAHEFIIDLREFKKCGIVEEDVAKRLQDYGFHSPTMSWPVPGTLMIEPTESEDRAELDRFCDALLAIRAEIKDVEDGAVKLEDSPLHHAPHTMADVITDDWDRAYSRETAAFPLPYVKESKFWPTVGRVDNVHGDRHLICTCPPMSVYEE